MAINLQNHILIATHMRDRYLMNTFLKKYLNVL